jgi:hypothetical protein
MEDSLTNRRDPLGTNVDDHVFVLFEQVFVGSHDLFLNTARSLLG